MSLNCVFCKTLGRGLRRSIGQLQQQHTTSSSWRDSVIRHSAWTGIVWAATTGRTQCEEGNEIGERVANAIKEFKSQNQVASDSFDWQEMVKSVGDKADEVIYTGIPGQLGGGFVAGWCAGYSLKKVGKVGAFVVGLGFVTLQALSYSGYVHVDYNKMRADVVKVLDLNQDGKLDQDDLTLFHDQAMEVLTYNVSAGSGFGAGFYAGVRSA